MEYIPAKTIVSGYVENNTWFGTNYNMNIYKGCCHGCIYCDSRSDCYRIENFDTVRAKEHALDIIAADLQRKKKTGVIGSGAMSDPYNPFESELQLTRGALDLIHRYGFGSALITKSPLVTRDIDIFKKIQTHSPVLVKITITTANDELCKKLEQGAEPSSERFKAIKTLSDNGIYCGVVLMPLLPFINDTKENILRLVHTAKENGARFIFPSFGVTLRTNQRQYFYQKLDELFPCIKEKYMRVYGESYSCTSAQSKSLSSLFMRTCDSVGLSYKMKDIISAYKKNYGDAQLSLF